VVVIEYILAFLLAGTNSIFVAIQYREAWGCSKLTITMTSHWVGTKQVSPGEWTHSSTAPSKTVTSSTGAYRPVEADFMSSGSWWHGDGLTKVPKTLNLELRCQILSHAKTCQLGAAVQAYFPADVRLLHHSGIPAGRDEFNIRSHPVQGGMGGFKVDNNDDLPLGRNKTSFTRRMDFFGGRVWFTDRTSKPAVQL